MNRIMIKMVSVFVLAVATLGPQVVQAQTASPVLVQSFDNARSGCGGSFVSGPAYTSARNILRSQGYTFGVGVSALTRKSLRNVDIFVVNSLATPLTNDEVKLLEQFVERGGSVLDTRNMTAPPLLFGVTQIAFGDPTPVTTTNETNPDVAQLVKGVTNPVPTGAASTLTTGEGGIPFLKAANGSALGLVFPSTEKQDEREGRAVLIGDEEIFFDFPNGGCGSGFITNPSNTRLLSNIFGYLSAADTRSSLTVFDLSTFHSYMNTPQVVDGVLILRNTVDNCATCYHTGVAVTSMPPYTSGNNLQWAVLGRTPTGMSATLNIGVQSGNGDENDLSVRDQLQVSSEYSWVVSSPVVVDLYKPNAYFYIPAPLGQEIDVKRIVLGDTRSIQRYIERHKNGASDDKDEDEKP